MSNFHFLSTQAAEILRGGQDVIALLASEPVGTGIIFGAGALLLLTFAQILQFEAAQIRRNQEALDRITGAQADHHEK